MSGVAVDELDLEDAIGIAQMAVTLGRGVPAHKWVDWMVERKENEALEGLT